MKTSQARNFFSPVFFRRHFPRNKLMHLNHRSVTKVYSDDSPNLQTGFVGKYFKSFDSEIKTFLCCHSLIGLYLLPDRDCSASAAAASPIHANISMQIFYSIVLAAVTILIHFMCFPNSSIYIQFIDVSKSIKPSRTFITELFSVFSLRLSTMVNK